MPIPLLTIMMRYRGSDMNTTYLVRLTDDARRELLQLTRSGKAAAYEIKHAHILLQVDVNGPSWSDAHVAKALHCHGTTVRTKPAAPSRQRLLDGAKEAQLM